MNELRLRCSQCGNQWHTPACGPTHAMLAAEVAEAGRAKLATDDTWTDIEYEIRQVLYRELPVHVPAGAAIDAAHVAVKAARARLEETT